MYEFRRTGRKFGNLKVVGKSTRVSRESPSWFCQCDCGNHRTVDERRLDKGVIMMCIECEIKKKKDSLS